MTLALIAGQGGLPPHLVRHVRKDAEVPLVCEMEQFPSDIEMLVPRIRFRVEQLGSLLLVLRDAGVTRLCMAGAVRRPPVDPGLIDVATLPLVPRFQAAMRTPGDDALLRIFVEIFEEAGLRVIGASEIDPGLLPPAGIFAAAAATSEDDDELDADLVAARAALVQMGRQDLGQAVVVRDGAVIAREDDSGTDALLDGLASAAPAAPDPVSDPMGVVGDVLDGMADWLTGPEAEAARQKGLGHGGLLYKAPKPGQNLRVDMPVIGPDTVMRAAAAGLRGIVIEEGGVMVMEQDRLRAALDKTGLFLRVQPGMPG